MANASDLMNAAEAARNRAAHYASEANRLYATLEMLREQLSEEDAARYVLAINQNASSAEAAQAVVDDVLKELVRREREKLSWADPSLACVLEVAAQVGVRPALPPSLSDHEQRRIVVERVEKDVLRRLNYGDAHGSMDALADELASDASSVPGVKDVRDRKSLLLRLWAGCLMAGKAIASETNSGPNSPEGRRSTFLVLIDPVASDDDVFRAGVEIAPLFKAKRKDGYSLRGVPSSSACVRYRVLDAEYESP